MRTLRPLAGAAISLALATAYGVSVQDNAPDNALLKQAQLHNLDALEPMPRDPSNVYADVELVAQLGHRLFFDTRFSSNGRVACATCHDPQRDFQDGIPLAKGVGITDRRTMPV